MTWFMITYLSAINPWNVDEDADYVGYRMHSTATNVSPNESVWMVPGTYPEA